MSALYVYGLMMTAEAEAALAQASLQSPNTGIADARVTEQTAGPLTALVSTPLAYPVTQTRRNLVAHHRVLERVFAAVDVLPLPFGSVAANAETLRQSIAAHDSAFLATLVDIDGHVEISLTARWRVGVVFAEIVAADTELSRLREQLRQRPDDETYFERVELGRRVEAALDGQRKIETDSITADLHPLAAKQVTLPTTDDDILFNLVFLVRRADQAAFGERIQKLAMRHAERIEFRFAGPAPAYNFSAIPTDWLQPATLLGAA